MNESVVLLRRVGMQGEALMSPLLLHRLEPQGMRPLAGHRETAIRTSRDHTLGLLAVVAAHVHNRPSIHPPVSLIEPLSDAPRCLI